MTDKAYWKDNKFHIVLDATDARMISWLMDLALDRLDIPLNPRSEELIKEIYDRANVNHFRR